MVEGSGQETDKGASGRKKLSAEEIEHRFWKRVTRSDESSCWLWNGYTNHGGYGWASIGGIAQLTHRYAYSTQNPEIPKGLCVLHKCDNPPCCNPAHLFLGTNQDNVTDRDTKGRQCKGEARSAANKKGDEHWSRMRPEMVTRGAAVGGSKLTEEAVIEIRRLRAEGEKLKAIAILYGVTVPTVSMVVRRVTWGHVPVVPTPI
tara:strand:- start:5 stop:613 length:609 start_codon:yes stop_codon:yes gene_type:complete